MPKNQDKKPTIEDVARHARVSVATVSRVLNRPKGAYIAADTRRQVLAVVEDLGYRPFRAGRTLRTQISHLVALLIPDITNAFYSAIAHSVEVALRELGYSMILCNTNETADLQDDYLDEMEQHQVAAILLLGAVDTPTLRKAAGSNTPIVLLNRRAPDGFEMPFVGIDNRAAGRSVAEHFVSRRYEPVGMIHGPLASTASRERFEGFRDRLAEAGRPLPQEFTASGELTIESGYNASGNILRSDARPAAIFCGNDLMAYGAYRRCAELGVNVPKDVALFGFDDNPLNDWLATWLSTVRVPYDRFGAATAQVIQNLLADNVHGAANDVVLPYQMTIRASA